MLTAVFFLAMGSAEKEQENTDFLPHSFGPQ
jgi:hypothetical protein